MTLHARILLRYAMAGVVLWFGINQLANPVLWAAWVPQWAKSIAPALTLVLINAMVEIVLGGLLLLGLFTRLSALILALNVFVIALSMGWNDIGVRDAGLAAALFSVFLAGTDKWCVDERIGATNRIVRVLQFRHRNP